MISARLRIPEAWRTECEIMARLSHGDLKTAALYTAKVNLARPAKSGFGKVEKTTSNDGNTVSPE